MDNSGKIAAFKKLLSSFNSRKVTFKFNLLDRNDNFKFTLGSVQNASITYNAESKIKSSFSFEMTESAETEKINFLTDRIQPVVIINDEEFKQGIFLLNSSMRNLNPTLTIDRPITCYDKLQILEDDKVDSRYYIPANVKYTNVIKDIITGSTNDPRVEVQDSNMIVRSDKEFEIGTSKLDIINSLLKEINYTELYTNEEGYFLSNSYELPSLRDIDFQYRANEQSVIDIDIQEELDLFNVPNKYIRYVDSPDVEKMISVYTNNDPNNILSTVNRGRTIVDVQSVDNIVNQTVLDAYTQREAYNYSNPYGTVSFKTAIMPTHWYNNILYLDIPHMGVQDKYEEVSWGYRFVVGGLMEHKVRRVVNV